MPKISGPFVMITLLRLLLVGLIIYVDAAILPRSEMSWWLKLLADSLATFLAIVVLVVPLPTGRSSTVSR